MEKVPYMIVIGDQETENRTVAVRSRKDGQLGSMKIDEFVNKVLGEINSKAMQKITVENQHK